MLEQTIRDMIKQAMRDRDAVARDVLKLALGEVTSARAVGDVSEEQAVKLVRKIVEANHETIAALESRGGDDRIANLRREIDVLEALLPKQWTADDIERHLREDATVLDQIQGAQADGQAMGMAMKALKAQGAPVDGKVVGEVVRKLRA
jgi:uncharacterized protein YqeY